jgi:hypothetical protein
MADIKRPNYFTSQFLVDRDFIDEQTYHLASRRRHNRVQHTPGVVDGLDVTRISATQVQVGAGTAIDSSGREIVVADPQTYTLVTAGNDLDVFLMASYQELLDPADHYTQAGLDKFTRTTEHAQLSDGTAAPPTDGSVIVLARIHLNATGAIESAGSIDVSVRTLGGPRVPPKFVTTTHLADGAVTLTKLADDAQPTAVQVDNRGGVNQLVAQINAGTGLITRAHLESAVVSGAVTFQNLSVGAAEMFSDDIDPGFGPGVLALQLAIDDLSTAGITSIGDTNYARSVLVRSEVNRATGRFKVFVSRNPAVGGIGTGPVIVRWYAFKPQTASDVTVGVGLTVNPTAATLASNGTQTFTAAVTNSSQGGVTWSIQETGGGVFTSSTPTSATYAPPILSGTYHVVATSIADSTKKSVVPITVVADIAVTVQASTQTMFRGTSSTLSATVINTANTAVTWSILQGAAGGTLTPSAGATIIYTAPNAPGTYTIVATSVADPTKKGSTSITVPQVTLQIAPDANPVSANGSTVIRATVGGSTNTNVNWASQSVVASVSPAVGPTTTFHAPGVGGSFTVFASAVADPTKTQQVTITVPNVKTGTEGGGGGGGGGGKFAPIQENISAFSAVASLAPQPVPPSPKEAAAGDVAPDAAVQARSLVTPKKRAATKLPPKPSDG